MFGRDPRLPIDLYADEDEDWNSRVDRVKYSTLHSERVNIIHGMVREIQSLSNNQNITRYDSKHSPVTFDIGESVLVWVLLVC